VRLDSVIVPARPRQCDLSGEVIGRFRVLKDPRNMSCNSRQKAYYALPRLTISRDCRNAIAQLDQEFECEFAGIRDCQSITMLSQSDRSLFKSLETYNRCECLLDWIRKLSNNKVLTILS